VDYANWRHEGTKRAKHHLSYGGASAARQNPDDPNDVSGPCREGNDGQQDRNGYESEHARTFCAKMESPNISPHSYPLWIGLKLRRLPSLCVLPSPIAWQPSQDHVV
jgi:hypothetical protein